MQTFIPYGGIYCVDMGVLVKLDKEFPSRERAFHAVWNELESMIQHGELFSCEFLEEEANRYLGEHTFIRDWIKEHKERLLIPNDAQILIAAAQVINENPHLLKKKNWEAGQNESDPYLIALGMVRGCTIITTESKTHPNRIPQVAAKYGVRPIDVYEFFDERGLQMKKVT